MDWIRDLGLYGSAAIIASIIVGSLVLFLLLIHLLRLNLNTKRIQYIYAFSSGFLIITAIVGQLVSARSMLQEHWAHSSGDVDHHDVSAIETLITIGIILSGAILGIGIAYAVKRSSVNHSHDHPHISINDNSTEHSHLFDSTSEEFVASSKDKNHLSIIYMILTHRVPAGLIIGIQLYQFLNGGEEYALGAFIAFVLHIFPELIIIYYSRIKAGYSRTNSFFYSIFVKLLFVPFIFFGTFIAQSTNGAEEVFWLLPLILAAVGMVMVWSAIFELGPVFIHNAKNPKAMTLIMLFLIGVILSMVIQLIHYH